MSDDQPGTILARLVASGIGPQRTRALIANGRVQGGGVVLDDPERVWPHPKPWVVAGQ